MSLPEWRNEGRLRRHKTSASEVTELLRVVDRDLGDAEIRQLSADRRFATAYNAALELATIALCAAGYRASSAGHHWVTLRALPEIMGPQAQERADYFDACRSKRNLADYDRAGIISDVEADEILREARAFKADLIDWLSANHPHLVPG